MLLTRRGVSGEYQRITRDNSNPVLYFLSVVLRLLTYLVNIIVDCCHTDIFSSVW